VQSVDVNTGQAAPFTRLYSGVSQAPIIANNTLYILQDNGKISAWR
jgi:outer membrane protein assembly factor BamB